jgi:hypothetical protein
MTKATLGALLVAASLLAFERRAEACAGCSNPNLPVARASNVALGAGEISASVNLTLTTMHVVHSESCPDIGPVCATRAEPPQQHDQRFYVGELRPIVALGLTDVFAVEAQVPVRVVSTTIQFRRLDGTPFEPDYENIHHRNETLYGVADPWLLGRASGAIGKVRITTRAGLGLPAGSTEEDPFARGRAGLSHQHIQFGTGTVHPVFAIDAGVPIDRTRIGAYAQALVFVYENARGYHAGNRYTTGLFADAEAFTPKLRLGLSGDVLNEQPERWGGVVQQDGNVGRTDVLAGVSASYAFGRVVASVTFKTPVYQHFIRRHDHGGDPGQLTYPGILNLAVSSTFDGGKPSSSAATFR